MFLSEEHLLTSRIQPLDAILAVQIAAGEIVERPLSVVKELLENSIDAGATQISIDLEQGGMQLIRVRDNGIGIHKDDLQLAISRHATSKIKTLEDLNCIHTLGFRGEALASIASVSKLSLSSAQANGEGYSVTIAGEAMVPAVVRASHPIGTSVEVRDLFFNIPARRKFLRSPRTEYHRIDEVVKRIILPNFNVNLNIKHNKKITRQYFSATSLVNSLERLVALVGEEFVEQAIYFEAERESFKVKGWLALPSFSRCQPDLQYTYVNQRIVKDKLMMRAIKEAYHDILYRDRYPACILFLEVPPNEVDVNVHPTKNEVKFLDSRFIYDFLCHSIKEGLAKEQGGNQRPKSELAEHHSFLNENKVFVSPLMRETTAIHDEQSNKGSSFSISTPSFSEALEESSSVQQSLIIADRLPRFGRVLSQIHGTYILSENDSGLVLVDMHGAHERILYEKMKVAISEQEKIPTQILLIPFSMKLGQKEISYVEENLKFFEQLGFIVDVMTKEILAIREVPQWIKTSVNLFFHDLVIDVMTDDHSTYAQEKLNHVLATLSCRSAIQAGRSLNIQEMEALLQDMECIDWATQCNHGRPTVIELSFQDIDKLFLRGR